MRKPKKPRNKRYTPRAVSIPMMLETRDMVALQPRTPTAPAPARCSVRCFAA